ncbi:TnsA-like heteromeric transposase endonuclease subunit [Streptomyces kanamyceticus]|uniref:TnsA-like heteromeric transposase endonuclease subunit n=1 Tax=Streptomyces kanamyceticus TaxID=1967 RepID=UPI0037DD4B61
MNTPGWYWAATTGRHVGFKSRLERDRLLLIDFDPNMVGISSQPFSLHWRDDKRERSYAPDHFIRRTDGAAVVVGDVRADERVEPEGRRSVRGDASGLRSGRVAVRAAGDTEGGAVGERSVAVALPEPTLSARLGRGPAPGGLFNPGAADGGGGCGRGPAVDAAGVVHLLWLQVLLPSPELTLTMACHLQLVV